MSLIDDQAAELDELLDLAGQKCLYGRTYSPAYQIARRIKVIRSILKKKEEKGADPKLNEVEEKYLVQTAGLLLISSLTESKKLREIADALDAVGNPDHFQESLLETYKGCLSGEYPPTVRKSGKGFTLCSVPTLAQLKDAFAKKFPGKKWRGEFSVRKTLQMFGLPLSKGKKGRPVGSQPIISNRKG